MATTTNYGWTTPDDTSLVKDGASAIRTLGTSVDTTTKNLNPQTTLGDISFRSSTSNVNTRLGIGSTGQVLAVSGGVPAWTTVSAGGMTVLASGSFSNSASVVISSIDQTYKDLQLQVFNFKPATDGEQLYLRFNGDTANNYFTATATTVIPGVTSTNRFMAAPEADNSITAGTCDTRIINYTTSNTYKLLENYAVTIQHNDLSRFNMQFRMGYWNDLSAITSITMLTGGGNITSGSYILYGLK